MSSIKAPPPAAAAGSEKESAGPRTLFSPAATCHTTLVAVGLVLGGVAIGRPRMWVTDGSRAARSNRERQRRHEKLAGERKAVGEYEYGGRWLTWLIRHGYLAEPYPSDGRAFDKALRRAASKMVADVEAGRIQLTR